MPTMNASNLASGSSGLFPMESTVSFRITGSTGRCFRPADISCNMLGWAIGNGRFYNNVHGGEIGDEISVQEWIFRLVYS